jgi:hypothetical protein
MALFSPIHLFIKIGLRMIGKKDARTSEKPIIERCLVLPFSKITFGGLWTFTWFYYSVEVRQR